MARREPLKSLPKAYELAGTFDIAAKPLLALGLNVLAALSVVVFGAVFLGLASLVRDPVTWGALSLSLSGSDWWRGILYVVVLTAVMLILHEGIHGIAFRLFTGEWGVFAFKGLYAYAAAPDWYLPRNQHIVTALAPFLGISVLGVALMAVVPAGWVPTLLLILVLNAAGAMGDLVIVGWLLTKPPAALVNDYGDGVKVYVHVERGPGG